MRVFTTLFFSSLSALFSSLTFASAALAARDVYDIPEPVAIQGRKYSMEQSFHFGVGYVPTDSFNRGFPASVAYRYAIKPWLFWEVLNYSHVFNKETQLKTDLLNLNVETENIGLGGVLDYPRQIFMTGLHYSPLYSKSLAFNSSLVYNEFSLFFGAGTIVFNKVGHKPMIAPGLAARFYFSPKTAMTAYIRDYIYKDDNVGINGILDFGIGFEFNFRLFGGGSDGDEG